MAPRRRRYRRNKLGGYAATSTHQATRATPERHGRTPHAPPHHAGLHLHQCPPTTTIPRTRTATSRSRRARIEPPPPGAGPRTSRPASPVDDDLLLSPPPPLFAEDWGARCSSPELWAHVGDLVEEPDVTYAGGFPEDYSDVFGAPAAALPAF